MTCRLWVQNADCSMTVRADRIVGVRVVREVGNSRYQWRMDLVVLDPAGDGASQVIPWCRGYSETYPEEVPRQLLALIAEHLDDPAGGTIDTANEDYADEVGPDPLGGIFFYASFSNGRSRPRPVR